MWAARFLIYASLATLLHSAYGAWLARTAAKAAGREVALTLGSPVPPEIIFEALGSLATLVMGILWSAPSLKGVTWASEMSKRSIDSEDSGVSLANVWHRGSVLFRETDEE